jgi:DNA-binding transcriptional MerR regulator
MTSSAEQDLTRLIPARAVARRYGVCLRSIDRWLKKGVIPKPTRTVNGRRYWRLDTLETADRQHTLNAGALAAGE